MDKKALILIAIAASLLLLGCQQQEQDPNAQLTKPFIGGTVGLNTYLLEGLPPPVVQDNGQSPFSIGVVLQNQGEADVGPQTDSPFVQVTLVGINPSEWNLDTTTKQLDATLRSARKNFDGTILPGEINTVTFQNLMYEPNIRGNTEFTMRAEVCYDYKTISTTKVCIKDDVLELTQDESICSLSGEKFPKNSGAPLHVTSVIQNPLASNKIQVAFTIEHVGIGQVYGREDGETCNPSTSNFNKNQVDVIVHPVASNDWTVSCSRFGGTNEGRVKLFQGSPQKITCSLERTSQSQGRVFQDVLEIELRYRYGQFIETPIIVQDVGNEPGGDEGP